MEHTAFQRDLAILDCYSSMAYACQLQDESKITDVEFALIKQGIKEFHLLALDGDIFLEEDQDQFNLLDQYLKKKLKTLEKKFNLNRSPYERFLFVRRLLLREGAYSVLQEMLPIISALPSIQQKPLFQAIKQIKGIYEESGHLPVEREIQCKYLGLQVQDLVEGSDGGTEELSLDLALLKELEPLLNFLKHHIKEDFHPEWLKQLSIDTNVIGKIFKKKKIVFPKDFVSATLATYQAIETLHEALLSSEKHLPQPKSNKKESKELKEFEKWLEKEGHSWEEHKNILIN